ncbi:uncharacterized protein LOC110855124 [Folsomia candida]|uniref:Uncharacterized protein n=1 Tax=Folsomia candida TaxID=158441 RepID=A0A226DUS1_FOLCA|nr:uncharacterized protein LOC110855124 [Folsomia candida]OXA48554.1 hypothetical protein Fcan01_16201 [Folsomia candida]
MTRIILLCFLVGSILGNIPPDFNVKFLIAFTNIPKKDSGSGKASETDPYAKIQNDYDHKAYKSKVLMDKKEGTIPGLFEFDWSYDHPIVFSVEMYDFDPGIFSTSDEYIGRTHIYQPQLWYENDTGVEQQVLYTYDKAGKLTNLQRDGQDSVLSLHYLIDNEVDASTHPQLKSWSEKKPEFDVIRIDK